MRDGVQAQPGGRVAEDQRAEPAAVEVPIGEEHRRTECLGDFRQRWLPRLHYLPSQLIGIHDLGAQRGEHLQHRRLS